MKYSRARKRLRCLRELTPEQLDQAERFLDVLAALADEEDGDSPTD